VLRVTRHPPHHPLMELTLENMYFKIGDNPTTLRRFGYRGMASRLTLTSAFCHGRLLGLVLIITLKFQACVYLSLEKLEIILLISRRVVRFSKVRE
jgi:hypothetical protein